jgi:hypothetical protein
VTAAGEFNPPLFYWIEHTVLTLGTSEFILRLMPALFGVLTIPLMYVAGTEFLDRNVGIIAAALLTFSPFHIFPILLNTIPPPCSETNRAWPKSSGTTRNFQAKELSGYRWESRQARISIESFLRMLMT